jgi:hypothetical protein
MALVGFGQSAGFPSLLWPTAHARRWQAYTAIDSGGEVYLNQLHADCGARIQYKKTCPIHGEVANDRIVRVTSTPRASTW